MYLNNQYLYDLTMILIIVCLRISQHVTTQNYLFHYDCSNHMIKQSTIYGWIVAAIVYY